MRSAKRRGQLRVHIQPQGKHHVMVSEEENYLLLGKMKKGIATVFLNLINFNICGCLRWPTQTQTSFSVALLLRLNVVRLAGASS